MAKPNYQFEKRRREMAKKAKKEEKKLRKLESDPARPEENSDAPKPESAN